MNYCIVYFPVFIILWSSIKINKISDKLEKNLIEYNYRGIKESYKLLYSHTLDLFSYFCCIR